MQPPQLRPDARATITAPARPSGLPTVWLLAGAVAIAQLLGQIGSWLILPIHDDFDLSVGAAASMTSLGVVSNLVGLVMVAALSRWLRLLTILRVGLIATVSGTSLAASSHELGTLGAAVCIAGIGLAFTWIPAPLIAASAVSPAHRPLAIGILGAGVGIGNLASSQIGRHLPDGQGDVDWRIVCAALAGLGVIAVLATLWLQGDDSLRLPTRSSLGGFGVLRRMPGGFPILIAYLSFGLFDALVVTSLNWKLLIDDTQSSVAAGLVGNVFEFTTVVGALLVIAVARQIGARPALALAFVGGAASSLVLLFGRLGPNLVAAVGGGLVLGAVPVLLTLYILTHTSSADYAPTFVAATSSFVVAQIVGALVGGAVITGSGSIAPAFLLSAGLATVGLVAALQIPKPIRSEPGRA